MYLPVYSSKFVSIELLSNAFQNRFAHWCKNQSLNLLTNVGTKNIK